jgi:hypothetical protein
VTRPMQGALAGVRADQAPRVGAQRVAPRELKLRADDMPARGAAIPFACGFIAARRGCALASCLRASPCAGIPLDLAEIIMGEIR